jgi:hypothetical protein
VLADYAFVIDEHEHLAKENLVVVKGRSLVASMKGAVCRLLPRRSNKVDVTPYTSDPRSGLLPVAQAWHESTSPTVWVTPEWVFPGFLPPVTVNVPANTPVSVKTPVASVPLEECLVENQRVSLGPNAGLLTPSTSVSPTISSTPLINVCENNSRICVDGDCTTTDMISPIVPPGVPPGVPPAAKVKK